jgi:hemerythrin superfamily protein
VSSTAGFIRLSYQPGAAAGAAGGDRARVSPPRATGTAGPTQSAGDPAPARKGNVVALPLPLPPLPDVGVDAGVGPAGRTVVDVVTADHRRLGVLCAELTDASVDAGRRRRVAQVVVATLSRHLSAEEQYLYPAVRAAVPGGEALADREVAEDHAILVTLRQVEAGPVDDDEFDRLAAAVAVQVRRHAESAAAELLPLLQQMGSGEELVRLGNRMETAQEAAPTRPHPGTPATPPWNKVIDPTVGVLDKVRDAMSRRVTYPQDL